MCEYLKKSSSKSLLLNFVINSIILLTRRTTLADYKSNLQGNWKTKESSYNTSSKNDHLAENNNDMIKKQERDLKNDNNIDN